MKNQLAKLTTNLAMLTAFVDAYADKLPEHFGHIDINDTVTGTASFRLHLGSSAGCDAQERDRALSLIGDTFGRNGWTKGLNCRCDAFDWSQDFNGVLVTIFSAEPIPQALGKMPVPASAFPIQLEDAK